MKRKIMSAVGVAAAASLALAGCGGRDRARGRRGPGHPHPGRLEPRDHAGVPDARRRLPRGEPGRHRRAQGVRRRPSTTRPSPPTSPPATAPDIFIAEEPQELLHVPGGRPAARRLRRGGRARPGDRRPGAVRGRRHDLRGAVPPGLVGPVLQQGRCSTRPASTYPDGSWTWDDYAEAAEALTEGIEATDGRPRAPTSTAGSRPCRASRSRRPTARPARRGDYEYLEPYYDACLALQDAGAQRRLRHGRPRTSSPTRRSSASRRPR